jgi:GNAT superfamily N-acetyltransferase
MEARRIPADSPDAQRLVRAMIDDVIGLYGDMGPGPSAEPADFSPPGGAFLALYDGDVAVAGGGIKRLDDETAELKRMYVAPSHRGRGLARIVLAELEAAARDLGYRRVRLDTGVHQHAALRLYPSAGYCEIDDYNGNPYASYWGEKRL